jgi:amino acid transporter
MDAAVTTGGEQAEGPMPQSGLLRRELIPAQVLMQAIGTIAPAATFIFVIGGLGAAAGVLMSGAVIIGGLVCLGLAISISYLARRIPSAGGYYAWTSAVLGARVGLAVGLTQVFIGLGIGLNIGYIGQVIHDQLDQAYGWSIPWPVTLIVIVVGTRFLVWRGIKLSGKAVFWLGAVELLTLVVLGVWGFFHPGPGGGTLNIFSSGAIPAGGSFFLAVTFAIFFFAGWEGAGPVAEEAHQPRSAIPRAMIWSLVILLVVYLAASLGATAGWGTDHFQAFGTGDEPPTFTLAHEFWHGAWVVLLLVLLNSVVCYALAGTLVVTRVLYAMARARVLPTWLDHLSPSYGTPDRAILVELTIMIVLGLSLGAWLGPDMAFFTYALAGTLCLCAVYAAGNLAVAMHFVRTERAAFRPVPHLILPIITTGALAYTVYKSVSPFPDYPIGGGIWWAIGWILVVVIAAVTVGGRAVGQLLDPEGDRVEQDELVKQG